MHRRLPLMLLLALTAAACAKSATGPANQAAPGTEAGARPPVATDGPGATPPDQAASPAAAGAASAASPDTSGGPVTAAPVKFVDMKGLRAELQERRKSGRPVFLNFWATWCAPCVDELPALGNLARELSPKDPEIIGVALDALTVPDKERIEPKVRDMLSQSRVSYSNLVLMGDQESFMKEFDVSGGIPLSILYDGGGKTVQRWVGSVEMNDLRRAFQSLPPA
jgi:thiol-disulfide isomerase/thioredoxin